MLTGKLRKVGGRLTASGGMLNYKDGEHGSYLEIADALSECGSQPIADKKELWKRIVLNILISNYDDHLRNHARVLFDPA